MKQELTINLVPIQFSRDSITVYLKDAPANEERAASRKSFIKDGKEGKVFWDIVDFEGAQRHEISPLAVSGVKKIISRHLYNFFLNKGLIVGRNFLGGVRVLIEASSRHPDIRTYKEFSVTVIPPKDQYICQGHRWTLNISYLGFKDVLKKKYSELSVGKELLGKVVSSNRVISALAVDAEGNLNDSYPLLTDGLRAHFHLSKNFYRTPNKYQLFYNEVSDFYNRYLRGVDVFDVFSIFESGFQKIPDSQIVYTSKDSNMLVFGNNQVNVNTYNGLKENGPYAPVQNHNYKFIFIFHKDDKDYANKLYSFFSKGYKGYPGLNRFVDLDLKLDKERSIIFEDENPVSEISQKLNQLSFDSNTKYLALYLSRIHRDELDPEKRSFYFKIKRLLLEKNISSQVIFKDNIENSAFNYYLPNISIALLAKIGGIPWRLSSPIKDDLVIGVGASREEENLYLGTTVAFRNDGTFVSFDSKKTSTIDDLGSYFHEVFSKIPSELPETKRIVIHYYKTMNHEEEEVIQHTLTKLGLKIPYIVVTITEDRDGTFVPFDMNYPGRMPTSGTCIVLRNGTYLLCNNTRYSISAGQKIDDFPYPVKLSISKTSLDQLSRTDVEDLLDQVYQFSRMYWVSIKQKGRPVTVEYSEKIAKISASFGHNQLPLTDMAKKSLWFL